jgi:hypothetical protein
MTEHDPKAEERVEDLDVTDAESEDVKGGALNAYIPAVTGEKQGKFSGTGFVKSASGLKSEGE